MSVVRGFQEGSMKACPPPRKKERSRKQAAASFSVGETTMMARRERLKRSAIWKARAAPSRPATDIRPSPRARPSSSPRNAGSPGLLLISTIFLAGVFVKSAGRSSSRHNRQIPPFPHLSPLDPWPAHRPRNASGVKLHVRAKEHSAKDPEKSYFL